MPTFSMKVIDSYIEMYDYLEKKILLPEKQKGVRESVRRQLIYCLLTKWYLGRRKLEWKI